MVLGSLAFAAYYAWATTVPTVTIQLDEPVKWGAVECSAFLIVWIYAFFYLPLSVKLLWDSWVNLPREDPAALEEDGERAKGGVVITSYEGAAGRGIA
ncbi:hypothetical protein ACM66B_006113 [Microbotryomycetes sp. NB124-2]